MQDSRLRLVSEVKDGIIHFLGGGTLIPHAKFVQIGTGVELSPYLKIGMPGKPLDTFVVGDNARIYAGIIAPRNFSCGDYVTIHEGVFCYGRADAVIGHNSWFGMRCTLDAEGGFYVGNNFGAGQDTHLWSHIRYGDTVQGCNFLSFGQFSADSDVWFVGRCTSAPARHERWSVAMTESNVIRGMESNRVYSGNPAQDITEKIGTPYADISLPERQGRFDKKLFDWMDASGTSAIAIKALRDSFNVKWRTYLKTGSKEEVAFMRFLLPEAKFVPLGNEGVVTWLR